jgi:hypothetical protein
MSKESDHRLLLEKRFGVIEISSKAWINKDDGEKKTCEKAKGFHHNPPLEIWE